MRAWKAIPTFSGEKHFYAWLTVVAAHLCTDRLRSTHRCVPVADPGAAPGRAASDEQEERINAAADWATARVALLRISPRQRQILLEKEEAGWSCRQIAEYHQITVSAAMTALWRARQALRREFAEVVRLGAGHR